MPVVFCCGYEADCNRGAARSSVYVLPDALKPARLKRERILTDDMPDHNEKPDFGALLPHGLTVSDLITRPVIFRKTPYSEGWSPVPGNAAGWLKHALGATGTTNQISAATTAIAQTELSFYPGTRLIRLSDGLWSPAEVTVWCLETEGRLFRLDGTSIVIHDFNRLTHLELTADTVVDYLRFFCAFVHGEYGPFMLIEHDNQPCLPTGMDRLSRRILSQTARPVTCDGLTAEGFFTCSGAMFYSNVLFLVTFNVHPDGAVDMIDDDPVAADLPVFMSLPLG